MTGPARKDLDEQPPKAWAPRTKAAEMAPAMRVRCEGIPGHRCRRQVPASMASDVSGLPEAQRGAVTHVCDSCRDLLEQRVGADVLAEAQGAPTDWVQWRREKQARAGQRAADEVSSRGK